MNIERIYQNLDEWLVPGKVLVIFGPRQAGKTTLIKTFLKKTTLKYKFETGDNLRTQDLFSSQSIELLLSYTEGYELIVIDEAQLIPNIGWSLKLLIDHRPDITIIATGSSSFELAGQIGEPLTGRKKTITLFPVSQQELLSHYNAFELKQQLSDFLIFGAYPEIITAPTLSKKQAQLEELTHSYLLKDILNLDRVKSAKILLDLLRLVAYQIGQEVSHSELATQLGIDQKTVSRYLDIFEKSFILFNVRGYSKNLRKEIVKKGKYYFYDIGIRNTLIANLNPIDIRSDIGQLWENFIFIERMKKRHYQHILANTYFWRTYDQQEIDIVEERGGALFGYECKWNLKKVAKAPVDWVKAYPNAHFETITQATYLDFIT
jgi:predicted AAA+ superfamily ATPase